MQPQWCTVARCSAATVESVGGIQWGHSGVSGEYSEDTVEYTTRTRTTGTPPGPHHPPIPTTPGYPHHHRHPYTDESSTAHRPVDTSARTGMSVFWKLTPTGCSEKQLSGVSRALADTARLTGRCQPGRCPLAREAFQPNSGVFSQKGGFLAKQW